MHQTGKKNNHLSKNDRDLIRTFLSLPESTQEEIKRNGKGTCFVLIPNFSAYHRNNHPEVFQNGHHPPCIKHQGIKYHVLVHPDQGDVQKLKALPGSVIIPKRYVDQPISEFLSDI